YLVFSPCMRGNIKGIWRICEGKFPRGYTHGCDSWKHDPYMCLCSEGRARSDCQKCPDICACCDSFVYSDYFVINPGYESWQYASRFWKWINTFFEGRSDAGRMVFGVFYDFFPASIYKESKKSRKVECGNRHCRYVYLGHYQYGNDVCIRCDYRPVYISRHGSSALYQYN